MVTIDARGLSCPQPVIMTKRAMNENDELLVLVSERSSAENVAEMARSSGATAEIGEEGADFQVVIRLAGRAKPEAGGTTGAVVWVIDSETIGRGDDELGRLLRKSFLGALAETDERPARLILINSGVKLAAEGSAVLDSLRSLTDSGVEILACGTCLDYYDLKDKIAVGDISNMYNFIELLIGAKKVITF